MRTFSDDLFQIEKFRNIKNFPWLSAPFFYTVCVLFCLEIFYKYIIAIIYCLMENFKNVLNVENLNVTYSLIFLF